MLPLQQQIEYIRYLAVEMGPEIIKTAKGKPDFGDKKYAAILVVQNDEASYKVEPLETIVEELENAPHPVNTLSQMVQRFSEESSNKIPVAVWSDAAICVIHLDIFLTPDNCTVTKGSTGVDN